MSEIGGFEGWGGLIYALTHLTTLWSDPSIAYQAKGIVEFLATHLPQDDKFDISRGSAGALIALLTLHDAAPYQQALDVAIACGDHLLAFAKPTPQGLTWSIPSIGVKPKNDFLHGNPLPPDRLLIKDSGRHLLNYAPPLFRVALSSTLDIRWTKPKPPITDEEAIGQWISDQINFLDPQRLVERALATSLVSAPASP